MDAVHLGIVLVISLALAYVLASIVWKGIELLFKTIVVLVLTIIIAGILFLVLR